MPRACSPPRVLAAAIAAARADGKPVVLDPKGKGYARYRGVTAITPNLLELSEAVEASVENTETALKSAARDLLRTLGCGAVLVTRSERGVIAVGADGDEATYPADARRVVDVSGAGDTLVAGFCLALAADASLANAAKIANAAAGIVVGKRGTAQAGAAELREAVLSRPHFRIHSKLLPRGEELAAALREWRRGGYVIGFTNGCFDILHPGHIELLRQARAHCDRLIVGLNSDASVRRLKGETRPIQNEAARATLLAAMGFVDAVVVFGEDTPRELLVETLPDVLVKGADYTIDQVVGHEIVEAAGGRVVLVELVPESSTTRIVEKLRGQPASPLNPAA